MDNRNKEEEILAAIAPQNDKPRNKRRRRFGRRLGYALYNMPSIPNPYTIKFPS